MPDRPIAADAEPPTRSPCPICGRASDPVLRPFCSKRCADIDLHRWLSGRYRIESDDEPDDPDQDSGDGRGTPE